MTEHCVGSTLANKISKSSETFPAVQATILSINNRLVISPQAHSLCFLPLLPAFPQRCSFSVNIEWCYFSAALLPSVLKSGITVKLPRIPFSEAL